MDAETKVGVIAAVAIGVAVAIGWVGLVVLALSLGMLGVN